MNKKILGYCLISVPTILMLMLLFYTGIFIQFIILLTIVTLLAFMLMKGFELVGIT